MEKLFKYIIGVFVTTATIAILITAIQPHSLLSPKEEKQFIWDINKINALLPRKVNSIVTFNHISFRGNLLTNHLSIQGDEAIKQFYEENHDTYRKMFMLISVVMNGQQCTGTQWTTFLKSKNIDYAIELTIPGGKIFTWKYSGKELAQFIQNCKQNPREALYDIITTEIKLTNLSLPIEFDDEGEVRTAMTNSITQTLSPGFRLNEIRLDGYDIIFDFDFPETDCTTLELKEYLDNNMEAKYNLVKEMTEDIDSQQFIDILVWAHCNLIWKCNGLQSKKSVEIKIPYSILKQFCNITSKNLLS